MVKPVLTFKAGKCRVDDPTKPTKVQPLPEQGYITLYQETDEEGSEWLYFSWRERSKPLNESEPNLVMIPGCQAFVPYEPKDHPTNGRIVVLKFTEGERHFFWLQTKPKTDSDFKSFTSRDRAYVKIVNALVSGDEIDVARELASAANNNDSTGGRANDDDETMEDVEGHNDPGATGGDIREEGAGPRDGGADGGRAASSATPDAAAAVRNFLDSLKGGANAGASQGEGKLYPLLSDLLTPPNTMPMLQNATEDQVNNLLNFLPPQVIVLSQQADVGDSTAEPSADAIDAAKQAMSLPQKKSLVEKILRSPQFHQSLTSLSMALRDGGLPTVADALQIKVENGGYIRGGQMPLGGGEAVEAFVEGVKKTVQEEEKK
ncbi:proteasome complex subunit Rpn13 ubiquitin receptor-domain-containing protein [Xylariomycetidae sp. FL0641]|nr:proteasome complex subunit Rpn13 ubiquitin receptor-domain-containing protein [Xylariomycetidae sp. FL0641]